MKGRSDTLTKAAEQMGAVAQPPRAEGEPEAQGAETVPDVLVAIEQRAIQFLKDNHDLQSQIRGAGVRWGTVQSKMAQAFKDVFDDPFQKVYDLQLVKVALDGVFGAGGWATSKGTDNKQVVKAV